MKVVFLSSVLKLSSCADKYGGQAKLSFYLVVIADESCSVFYGPDNHSPLKLGVCDVGSRSCKCTQGKLRRHLSDF